MYYKSHNRRNFYSTLCQTAKRNQRYNLIQSTENDSTSVEHNSKTLAQNKFNTRPKFCFFSKRHFSLYLSLFSSLLCAFSFSSLSRRLSELYICRQTPRDGELTRINQIILQPSREYAYARTT